MTTPHPELDRIHDLNLSAAHMADDADVMTLLLAWSDGDEAARSRLIEAVYDELRRVAKRRPRSERDDRAAGADRARTRPT